MTQRICRHILVSGRVQGVGYRWRAVEAARRFGVTGWVRNLPDGRVELVVDGEKAPVAAMVAWCRKGPKEARITGFSDAPRGEACLYDQFEIRRDR